MDTINDLLGAPAACTVQKIQRGDYELNWNSYLYRIGFTKRADDAICHWRVTDPAGYYNANLSGEILISLDNYYLFNT